MKRKIYFVIIAVLLLPLVFPNVALATKTATLKATKDSVTITCTSSATRSSVAYCYGSASSSTNQTVYFIATKVVLTIVGASWGVPYKWDVSGETTKSWASNASSSVSKSASLTEAFVYCYTTGTHRFRKNERSTLWTFTTQTAHD